MGNRSVAPDLGPPVIARFGYNRRMTRDAVLGLFNRLDALTYSLSDTMPASFIARYRALNGKFVFLRAAMNSCQ